MLDLDNVLDDSDSDSEDESGEELLHINEHAMVTKKLDPNLVKRI